MKHLSEDQEKVVLSAINRAERKTSGEIRVHIESHCGGHPVERAEVLFHLLDMDKTDLQNGVLFYLAMKDRKFRYSICSILEQSAVSAEREALTALSQRCRPSRLPYRS